MTVKDVFNLKTLFPNYGEKHLLQYNYIGNQIILSVFTIFFCIIGLVGNGNTIWLLGFHIKRKPFAIYILNLAVADFGSLVFLLLLDLCFNPPSFHDDFDLPSVVLWLLMSFFESMLSSSQLLLTAISIDRWVSVFFPNYQSPVLSTIICAFIWAISFGVLLMNLIANTYGFVPLWGHLLVSYFCLTCVLLMIISTLTLFIKVCLKSPRCRCGKLLKVTLLILLSFLLFFILAFASFSMSSQNELAYFFLWISLKGSINPLIYFLAGRESGGKFQERMKGILQRVFKEERDTRMELQPRTQTRL